MDISVYEGDRVLWCIEVKEKASDLSRSCRACVASLHTLTYPRPTAATTHYGSRSTSCGIDRRTSRWWRSEAGSTSA